MTALIRYTLATVIHSQRYLAPVMVFVVCVATASGSNQGPLPGVYAVNSGALLACAAWLSIAVISVEEPAHRAIAIVTAGSAVRVLIATLVTDCLVLAAMALGGLALPLLMAPHSITGADVLVGALAHLMCGTTGLAIGLLCSRLVFRRQGYAFLTASACVAAALLVSGMPPNTLFKHLANTGHGDTVLGSTTALATTGPALLAAAAVATHVISTRKD
ncbi:hypothetical protein V5P93_003389 [Actinokineospora auranticolor]|nr:hypothetical protein [Actinokineospora auranticolor]